VAAEFGHVPPPVPPAGTTDEFYTETGNAEIPPIPLPVGLGFRVPLILISPWTRGGWVTSEVFDHTSVIQFLEQWTTAIGKPAKSPNISAWRRAVCGGLTSAFDFKHPVFGLPELPFITAPVGEAREYNPIPASDVMPVQESGNARPVQYHVPAGKTTQHNVHSITSAGGWYDVTVTIDTDTSWSQRFSGHVETGENSITG
jgi:phospholipase C